jgi:acyl carrier protein
MQSPDRDTIRQALLGNLRRVVARAPEQIDDAQSLRADFGADSLQVVEIVSRTMRELKIRIPRTELARAKSISDLLDLFEASALPRAS